jgi:NAD(P)-dependent dehydrogenase (short-subunit alcohol dehydrogenase family)
MTDGARKAALEMTPSGEFGTTEGIADAAMFLALNRFVNGSQIVVDGGLSAT